MAGNKEENEAGSSVPRAMGAADGGTTTIKKLPKYKNVDVKVATEFPEILRSPKGVRGELRSIGKVITLFFNLGLSGFDKFVTKKADGELVEMGDVDIDFTIAEPTEATALATYGACSFFKDHLKGTTVSTIFKLKIGNKVINIVCTKDVAANVDPEDISTNDFEAYCCFMMNKMIGPAIKDGRPVPMMPKARVAFSDDQVIKINEILRNEKGENISLPATFAACNVATLKKPTVFVGYGIFVPELIFASIVTGVFGNEKASMEAKKIASKKCTSLARQNVDMDMSVAMSIMRNMGAGSKYSVQNLQDLMDGMKSGNLNANKVAKLSRSLIGHSTV